MTNTVLYIKVADMKWRGARGWLAGIPGLASKEQTRTWGTKRTREGKAGIA